MLAQRNRIKFVSLTFTRNKKDVQLHSNGCTSNNKINEILPAMRIALTLTKLNAIPNMLCVRDLSARLSIRQYKKCVKTANKLLIFVFLFVPIWQTQNNRGGHMRRATIDCGCGRWRRRGTHIERANNVRKRRHEHMGAYLLIYYNNTNKVMRLK